MLKNIGSYMCDNTNYRNQSLKRSSWILNACMIRLKCSDLGGAIIEYVETMKYLSIIIDDKL